MERISDLERKYVNEALDNAFRTSKNSIFNSRLEKEFAEKFGMKYAIGSSNGTATLHQAVAALGIKPGDEVIAPALTMASSSFGIIMAGVNPVFADSDRETFQISPESIEKCITPKTKAIMTVALYGFCPDYDIIIDICKKHNLYLIEDNAEAFGAKYKGKLVGTFGDFSSFSFQASKHLTTGEGGMLLTNNLEFADEARRFGCLGYGSVGATKQKISRNDIQDPAYFRHVSVGFNYRMSELQAACALGQLQRSDELVANHKNCAKIFDEAVKGQTLLIPEKAPEGCESSYWTYCCVLNTDNPQKDWYEFRDLFQKNGGDPYYAAWKLSYQEPAFQNIVHNQPGIWQSYEPGLCPNSEYLQLRMIQLKTNYWNLDDCKQQAEILHKTINEFQR